MIIRSCLHFGMQIGHSVGVRNRLELTINETSVTPVYEQLANEMRRLICAKVFAAGEQIPSIRVLADQLRVSPTTVRRAFQMLIDEGWLTQQRGSGTFVSDSIDLQTAYLSDSKLSTALSTPINLSEGLLEGTWAQRVSKVSPSAESTTDGAGLQIPPNQLVKYVDRALDSSTALTDPAGVLELRQQIASWIALTRSIQCEPADVIIVSGKRQAQSMVARLFGGARRTLLLEDPSSSDTKAVFSNFGWELAPIPVDESGLVIEELSTYTRAAPTAAYVQPSSQFPTGAVLSKMRRERLCEWAQQSNCIIVEDDEGCDFTYESRVTPALTSFMDKQRCIYIGSFSHIVPTTWQIAFIVLPESMREPFYRMKLVADRCTSPVVQNVLKEMFVDGQLQRTLTRLQRDYLKLRDELLAHLEPLRTDHAITYSPVKGGLNQAIWLPTAFDDELIAAECAERGISLTPISTLFSTSPARPGLMISFARFDSDALRLTISTLAEVMARRHGA